MRCTAKNPLPTRLHMEAASNAFWQGTRQTGPSAYQSVAMQNSDQMLRIPEEMNGPGRLGHTRCIGPLAPSTGLTCSSPTQGPSVMQSTGKAIRLDLFNFSTPQMRAFHMSWLAFFLCFFAWFGIAPLMIVVREEMHFTKTQVGWCVIGSVAITVFARLFIGWLCDRIGPRLVYTWLLILGALPVMV